VNEAKEKNSPEIRYFDEKIQQRIQQKKKLFAKKAENKFLDESFDWTKRFACPLPDRDNLPFDGKTREKKIIHYYFSL
jgi:hypothetical protein